LGKICKASLLTFFSKKAREKGVCGKVQSPSGLAGSASPSDPNPSVASRHLPAQRGVTPQCEEPFTASPHRGGGRAQRWPEGLLPLPVKASLPGKHRAGHARPLQRSKMKARSHHRRGRRPRRPAQQHAPHHVIFNARCTRYTMYLNSPAIRLNSTQT
jgi:hypothetical protein